VLRGLHSTTQGHQLYAGNESKLMEVATAGVYAVVSENSEKTPSRLAPATETTGLSAAVFSFNPNCKWSQCAAVLQATHANRWLHDELGLDRPSTQKR